jgi:hypothetical protein
MSRMSPPWHAALSSCSTRTVDTRSNATAIYTYAPRVTLPGQLRPISQLWGHFTTYTDVRYLDGG